MARTIEPEHLIESDDTRPWNEWLNGEYWTFDRNIDYVGRQDSLIGQIRYQARKRGQKIRLVQRTDDSFTIVAHKSDDQI